MQLSLRSQMVAGVAAVGATAIALTPIAQPDLTPALQRVSAAVQLSALDLANPITALAGVAENLSASIFSQAPLLDPYTDLFWPDSFYTPEFEYFYGPGYLGLVPDAANRFSTGGVSALINNVSGYAEAGIYVPLSLGAGVGAALFNAPVAVVNAIGYLAAGDTEAALAELQTQILGPLTGGIQGALAGVGYIVDNAIANVQTVLTSTVPGLVAGLVNQVVTAATYLVQSAVATAGAVITDLAALDFQSAWNNSVNGFIGPNGTLGQLVDLTVGLGIIEDVEYTDPDEIVPTVVAPSIRSVLTSAGQRLGDYSSFGDGGIANDAFEPPAPVLSAAAQPKRAASAAASVAAVKTAVAASPTAQAPAGDGPTAQAPAGDGESVDRPAAGDAAAAPAADTAPGASGAGDSADAAAPAAEKPVKERSARGAAKRAATR
jgi:hypothetical protein